MSRPPAPDADQRQYWHFTKPQQVCKALASIDGYLKGISADQVIVHDEVDGLRALVEYHKDVLDESALQDVTQILACICGGSITGDDLYALAWLQESFKKDARYFDSVTSDVQRLHAIMGGMAADSVLKPEELRELTEWVRSKPHLHDCWPFRQLVPLLIRVLKDGQIDSAEHNELLGFFASFDRSALPHTTPQAFPSDERRGIGPLCESEPKICFARKTFCLTGTSSVCPRKQIAAMVKQLGGIEHPRVTLDVDYLVYCKRGNAAWAYQCYGRKVETAMELRDKHEHDIQIVREIDFWNAVVEHGGAVPLKS